jgi:hypothetical protein
MHDVIDIDTGAVVAGQTTIEQMEARPSWISLFKWRTAKSEPKPN